MARPYAGRIISFVLSVIFLICLLFTVTAASAEAPYRFSDSAVEIEVNEAIYGPIVTAEPVTASDLLKLEGLVVRDAAISVFDDYRNMPNVSVLQFNRASLPAVDENTFAGNGALEKIVFNYCSFESLKGDIFASNEKIWQVSFINSMITDFEDGIFYSLGQRLLDGSLKELELILNGNFLSELKKDWFDPALTDAEWDFIKSKISWSAAVTFPAAAASVIRSDSGKLTGIYGFDRFFSSASSYQSFSANYNMLNELALIGTGEFLSTNMLNMLGVLEPLASIDGPVKKHNELFMLDTLGMYAEVKTSQNNAQLIIDVNRKIFMEYSYMDMVGISYPDIFRTVARQVLPGIKENKLDEICDASVYAFKLAFASAFGALKDNQVGKYLKDCFINERSYTDEEFYRGLQEAAGWNITPDTKAVYFFNSVRSTGNGVWPYYLYSLDLEDPSAEVKLSLLPGLEDVTLVSAVIQDYMGISPLLRAEVTETGGEYKITVPGGADGKVLKLTLDYTGSLTSENRYFRSFDLYILLNSEPKGGYEFVTPEFPEEPPAVSSVVTGNSFAFSINNALMSGIMNYAVYLIAVIAVITSIIGIIMFVFSKSKTE